jgi:hypothetical protein
MMFVHTPFMKSCGTARVRQHAPPPTGACEAAEAVRASIERERSLREPPGPGGPPRSGTRGRGWRGTRRGASRATRTTPCPSGSSARPAAAAPAARAREGGVRSSRRPPERRDKTGRAVRATWQTGAGGCYMWVRAGSAPVRGERGPGRHAFAIRRRDPWFSSSGKPAGSRPVRLLRGAIKQQRRR